jgi:hypothetical protein
MQPAGAQKEADRQTVILQGRLGVAQAQGSNLTNGLRLRGQT